MRVLIFQKLEAMTTDYKDARAVVGAYMLEQRTNLQNLSLQQIADATYTSRSTLVRIAKNLGYKGLRHHDLLFRQQHQPRPYAIPALSERARRSHHRHNKRRR